LSAKALAYARSATSQSPRKSAATPRAFHARQDPALRAKIDRELADGTLAPYAAVRLLLDAARG
jgi:CBS-domain-containing membrane protein